jgi:hypothetical protein
MVEIFSLVPSLLIVQLFRRIRLRRRGPSPLQQALMAIKPLAKSFVNFTRKNDNVESFLPALSSLDHVNNVKSTKKSPLTFPWWCLFIAYGLSLVCICTSILFIIARGIEFGDVKTQKWLTSILTGFFSSILFTQPIKVSVRLVTFVRR